MVAAIMAARNGAKVLILEHNEVPGKKILATGNGKCNYTNKVQGVDKYYGQNPAFVAPVFEQLPVWKRHCSSLKNLAYIQRSVTADIILRVSRQLQSGMCC